MSLSTIRRTPSTSRIDRKRKFLGTIFLRALGLRTDEEILKTFYTVDTINVAEGKLSWKVAEDGKLSNLLGTRPAAPARGRVRRSRAWRARRSRRPS